MTDAVEREPHCGGDRRRSDAASVDQSDPEDEEGRRSRANGGSGCSRADRLAQALTWGTAILRDGS